MANIQHIYSDIDLNFKPNLSTGDIALKYDAQSVVSSIRNLLFTNPYERLFQPDVGSGLNALLFEPLTTITATLIENEIIRTIENYEPRASISSVTVSASPDQNAFNVSLSVFILNQTAPTNVNLILRRTR
jgi:phage baseplate assembly protein W